MVHKKNYNMGILFIHLVDIQKITKTSQDAKVIAANECSPGY